MRIETTEVFACPIETLWAHVEEPARQKMWMKGLLAHEPTSPAPVGVGSTSRMVIREGRRDVEYRVEVTAYDRPRHLAVVLTGGNFPRGMTMRVDYRLTQEGARTRLDYAAVATCEKAGIFLRLAFVVFRLFGKMQLKGFMRSLRKLVEAPPTATS